MPGDLRALQDLLRETALREKPCFRACYDHEPRCMENMVLFRPLQYATNATYPTSTDRPSFGCEAP
jgi:hypothetical protein